MATASDERDRFARLVAEVRNGSDEASRELIQLYGPHVLRAVRRRLRRTIRTQYDSIDFVQAVWASVFADPAQLGRFDDPGAMVAYLTQIAYNKVVDETRRLTQTAKYRVQRERSIDDERSPVGDELAANQPTPSEVVSADEQWRRMVEDYEPAYQPIFELRRQGYTLDQIAAQLGLSERTVRRVLERASRAPKS